MRLSWLRTVAARWSTPGATALGPSRVTAAPDATALSGSVARTSAFKITIWDGIVQPNCTILAAIAILRAQGGGGGSKERVEWNKKGNWARFAARAPLYPPMS